MGRMQDNLECALGRIGLVPGGAIRIDYHDQRLLSEMTTVYHMLGGVLDVAPVPRANWDTIAISS